MNSSQSWSQRWEVLCCLLSSFLLPSCGGTLLLGDMRKSLTDQSSDITKMWLGEPLSLLESLKGYRWGLFTGGWMEQRQLCQWKPNPHGWHLVKEGPMSSAVSTTRVNLPSALPRSWAAFFPDGNGSVEEMVLQYPTPQVPGPGQCTPRRCCYRGRCHLSLRGFCWNLPQLVKWCRLINHDVLVRFGQPDAR